MASLAKEDRALAGVPKGRKEYLNIERQIDVSQEWKARLKYYQ